jgi:hypothetical protein
LSQVTITVLGRVELERCAGNQKCINNFGRKTVNEEITRKS